MKILSFDTETYLIGDTEKAPKPVICSWFNGERSYVTHPSDAWTLDAWYNPEHIFVGVNIAYDILCCMRWHPHLIPPMIKALDEGRVFDCPIRESLTHLAEIGAKGYNPQTSLADLAHKYLGVDMSAEKTGPDIWRLKFGTLDGVPYHEWPLEAMNYVLKDAEYPWRIFQLQGGLQRIYPTEVRDVRAAVTLNGIGVYGFHIDQKIRSTIKTSIEAEAAKLATIVDPLGWIGTGSQKKMQPALLAAWHNLHMKGLASYAVMTGVHFDVVSWRQQVPNTTNIQFWLRQAASSNQVLPFLTFPAGIDVLSWQKEAAAQLPEIPITTRGVSSAEENMEAIANELPEIRSFVDLKHQQKMLATYVEPYANETVHGRFMVLHSTGRTACRNPAMQTIPRKSKDRPNEAFRTMFTARPGRILGTSDYSQVELCTLAAVIRDKHPNVQCRLGEALDAGIDVHCLMGGAIINVSYEQMMKNKKVDGSPEAQARQGSKPVNFGVPGGMGQKTFLSYAKNNYGVVVTAEETALFFKEYRKIFPDVIYYLAANGKALANAPEGRGTSTLLTGRQKAGLSYTEYCNIQFQGLAADGAKGALWAIWREAILGFYWKDKFGMSGYGWDYGDGPLRDSALVNFVHDEIVGEHPEGKLGEEALKRQDKLMVDEMLAVCKHLVPIKVESKLSHQWEH